MCTALSCRDSGLEDKPEPPGDPTADGVREDRVCGEHGGGAAKASGSVP